MINPTQLKDLIIEPVLKEYELYSEAAVNLLLGTCAQESRMGYYLKQVKGPALGIYQMEPLTHNDLWEQVMKSTKKPCRKIADDFFWETGYTYHDLISDLKFATIMCRLQYWRFPEPLPEVDDIEGLAKYWKKYYNTEKGKGTVEQFIKNYENYVLGISRS